MIHAYDVFNTLRKIKSRDPDFNGIWVYPFSSLTDFLSQLDENFKVTFKTRFLKKVEKESQNSPFNISRYSRSSEEGYLAKDFNSLARSKMREGELGVIVTRIMIPLDDESDNFPIPLGYVSIVLKDKGQIYVLENETSLMQHFLDWEISCRDRISQMDRPKVQYCKSLRQNREESLEFYRERSVDAHFNYVEEVMTSNNMDQFIKDNYDALQRLGCSLNKGTLSAPEIFNELMNKINSLEFMNLKEYEDYRNDFWSQILQEDYPLKHDLILFKDLKF